MWWTIAIALGFLAGSIPTGLIIGRAHGIDIRAHGSGNIGATNVGRVLGPRAWLLCFIGDFLKGFAPTFVAGWLAGLVGRMDLAPDQAWPWLTLVLAPVLGHMFSPWLGFRGGKGVATGLGAILGVFPALTIPGLVALLVFVGSLAAWRYVSLASLLAAATLPASVLALFALAGREGWFGPPRMSASVPFVIVTTTLAGLVIVRHRANLGRLRAGTEPKLGDRSKRINRTGPDAAGAG